MNRTLTKTSMPITPYKLVVPVSNRYKLTTFIQYSLIMSSDRRLKPKPLTPVYISKIEPPPFILTLAHFFECVKIKVCKFNKMNDQFPTNDVYIKEIYQANSLYNSLNNPCITFRKFKHSISCKIYLYPLKNLIKTDLVL